MSSEWGNLQDLYDQRFLQQFSSLPEALESYHSLLDQLKGDGSHTVTLDTPTDRIVRCAEALQNIVRAIRDSLLSPELDTKSLYLLATQPARNAGVITPENQPPVGIFPGEHYYFSLLRQPEERDKQSGLLVYELLVLLQRVPLAKDTQPEVHGIRDSDEKAPYGGIEVYLPLTDGIRFRVNHKTFALSALEGLITIFPGDLHHHCRTAGPGPARVLIIAGFGFSRGVKTENPAFIRSDLASTPRFIKL